MSELKIETLNRIAQHVYERGNTPAESMKIVAELCGLRRLTDYEDSNGNPEQCVIYRDANNNYVNCWYVSPYASAWDDPEEPEEGEEMETLETMALGFDSEIEWYIEEMQRKSMEEHD